MSASPLHFRRLDEDSPERRLETIPEIEQGRFNVMDCAHSNPNELSVEPLPKDSNPDHAEIPWRITRGLATAMLPDQKRQASRMAIREFDATRSPARALS
ncbi:MAG: hypothetical protein KF791_19555 [Verrucomicrobiae bacterium]|nr:hypothetical protein [Verrucomicrobiae bacterium]